MGAVVRGDQPHGTPELQRVRGRVVATDDWRCPPHHAVNRGGCGQGPASGGTHGRTEVGTVSGRLPRPCRSVSPRRSTGRLGTDWAHGPIRGTWSRPVNPAVVVPDLHLRCWHPQRDSNPGRHLERSARRERRRPGPSLAEVGTGRVAVCDRAVALVSARCGTDVARRAGPGSSTGEQSPAGHAHPA
jgi:hypothetical protein